MLSALFAVSAAVKAEIKTGEVNSSITWTYNTESCVLTLSGSGAMPNYESASNTPWAKHQLGKKSTIKSDMEYLIVGEDITSIGNYSFAGTDYLVEVILPNSVKSIGSNAFDGCGELTAAHTEEGVSLNANLEVAEKAFNGTGLFQNNVLYLDDNKLLVQVSINYVGSLDVNPSTKRISPNAFANCVNLTAVTIPSSVTSIGADAFEGCSNLTTVTFNANVKTFGNWFEGLSKLTTINIPASVTTISNNAFAGCTSLTNVTFGKVSNITTWGSNIFSGVTGKTVGDYKMIGNSVILKAISNSAPDARYKISSSVAYIADNAFADVDNSTVYLDLRGRDNAPVLASSAFNGIAGFKTIVKNGKEGNFNSKVWSNINTTTIEVPSEKYTTCMFMYDAVVPEGIAVYTAKSNAEGKVVLTKINKNNARTVVPAGVGFMLRADNKTTATFVSAKNEAAVSVNENELKGAEDYTYFTGDENPYVYILSTVDGKQGFYRAGSTNKLKIGKAYLQSNTQMHSLAKMSLWEGESETSGISNAQMSENSNAKGYVYNLNGSRMSSPQKGVNIINGKKVIIK